MAEHHDAAARSSASRTPADFVADHNLEAALKRFQRDEQQAEAILWMHSVRFNNRLTFLRLTAFLLHGRNRCGRPVHHLKLSGCSLDDEALSLLCEYFSSNQSPETLKRVALERLRGSYDRADQEEEDVYEHLMASFHSNTTVKELSLYQHAIQGAPGGTMVGALLQNNTNLAVLNVGWSLEDIAFIQALRDRFMVANSRCLVRSVGFQHRSNTNDENEDSLDKLKLVFEKNEDGQHDTPIFTQLNLRHGYDPHFRDIDLGRLLLTMPGLQELDVSKNWLSLRNCPSELFQEVRHVAVMGRLQKIVLSFCFVNNANLAQIAAAMPGTALVTHLDISRNNFGGRTGGLHLGRLLRRCGRLETLVASCNLYLGPQGAQALAPALARHDCLQKVDLSFCRIAHAAMDVLASLAIGPQLKSLDIGNNNLPTTAIESLTGYVNITKTLEVLKLSANPLLFRQSSSLDRRAFFEALTNHKRMKILDLTLCGTNEETTELLLSTLFKNLTLVCVEHSINQFQSITAEYTRRNIMLSNAEATMGKPVGIPFAIWPVALARCLPREASAGPTACFILARKMNEANVYEHPASNYRNEKVRATTRIQRWWRGE